MPFAAVSTLFGAGFVLAHVWGVIAFSAIVGVTERFWFIATGEVLVAVLAFSVVRGRRRGIAFVASGATAALFGFIASAFTVGPLALVPPFGAASLVVYFVAIGVLSAVLGLVHSRFWSERSK